MREAAVEKQVQQMLLYVQGRSADIQKENVIENLERGLLNYKVVEDFLLDLKDKFGKGDKEANKIAKLKRLEQGGKIMKEFVQEFRRVVRECSYKGKPLVKEFKRGMNGTVW